MISVVIITMNERDNIERCLRSVAFSDDILVVDSGSTDGTCEIARSLGARVMTRPFDHFAGQRNFAIDEGGLRHDWVLHLDADEVVDDQLAAELEALVKGPDPDVDAFLVPFKMMLFGQWLRRAGMYPGYQCRVGRRAGLRFVMVGHGQREDLPPERVGRMNGHLVHYNFSKGMPAWFEKHVRYARDEAAAMAEAEASEAASGGVLSGLLSADGTRRRRALKQFSRHLPFRPLLMFLYVYVVRLGFLDGRAGYQYATMVATYHSMIDVCLAERRREGRASRVAAPAESTQDQRRRAG